MKKLLRDSLEKPIGFPPCLQMFVPGDQVVIAPEPFFAENPVLLTELVAYFLESDENRYDISILLLEPEAGLFTDVFQKSLPMKMTEKVKILRHNPSQPSCFAMFAVKEDDKPILANRFLVEADVILPVGHYRKTFGKEYYGIHTPLYPRFSDHETQKRFQIFESAKENQKMRQVLEKEMEDAAAKLGVCFTIQVCTDFHDKIVGIFAGEVSQVKEHLAKICQ
ncbi:MAG: hypothetical protein LBQ54_13680 [Planctomycetaceae bacterium]|jgi:hypothetical protein|nr:hypothetical protein [Planctomycetaceae bacterium]